MQRYPLLECRSSRLGLPERANLPDERNIVLPPFRHLPRAPNSHPRRRPEIAPGRFRGRQGRIRGPPRRFSPAQGFPRLFHLRFSLGALTLSGQTVIIFAASLALIGSLWLFFEKSLTGKALRATAVNRLGARLMGISSSSAGRLSFTMAAFIGALSGLLIGPTTTVFYDSGFLIGLKGFVAAVFAGLASYPLAMVGALGVGLLEAFGSFWSSPYKEVIVFSAILPILLWRSLRDPHGEEH